MVVPRFICKLLSNLWEHHVTTMLSEVFCLRLLTLKNQFVHTFLTDVMDTFSRFVGPIHEVPRRGELVQLPLMSVIFSATRDLYNISGLFVTFKRLAGFLGTCSRFFVDGHGHNSTALKVNGMTEDMFIDSSLWSKEFLCLVTRYKKVHVYAHNFSVSFFSSSDMHQSKYLDGYQAIGKSSSFIEVF